MRFGAIVHAPPRVVATSINAHTTPTIIVGEPGGRSPFPDPAGSLGAPPATCASLPRAIPGRRGWRWSRVSPP